MNAQGNNISSKVADFIIGEKCLSFVIKREPAFILNEIVKRRENSVIKRNSVTTLHSFAGELFVLQLNEFIFKS